DEPLGLARRAVVAHHRMAGGEEATGHTSAHGAQSDEAERGHGFRRIRRGRGLARRARRGPPEARADTTAMALIPSLHRAGVARRDTSTVVVVGRWPSR